mmetsp:Transcript_122280/g.260935  ORF Transcript_122280/g.260935 Transcript_122280/m.260935 type:complete len:191 (-) Transcript_122280:106-678(-)
MATPSGAARSRRRAPLRLLVVLLSASAAALAACGALLRPATARLFVVTPGAPDAAVQRRHLAAALAAQALLPAGAALAGDRDRASMIFNARRKYLPRIRTNYLALKEEGTITDEFLQTKLKKFISALELYGSIQRLSEAPDKVSKKLEKDARKIKEACQSKDYGLVMTLLDEYQKDVPAGAGEFSYLDTI